MPSHDSRPFLKSSMLHHHIVDQTPTNLQSSPNLACASAMLCLVSSCQKLITSVHWFRSATRSLRGAAQGWGHCKVGCRCCRLMEAALVRSQCAPCLQPHKSPFPGSVAPNASR